MIFARTLKIILTCLFIISIFSVSSTKAIGSSLDQYCNLASDGGRQISGGYFSQSFKPAVNRITQLRFQLYGKPGDAVTIGINTSNDPATALRNITIGLDYDGLKEYVFDFATITVTPGSTYYLYVQGASSEFVAWAYSNNANCYANGQSSPWPEFFPDFLFKTYGYNDVPTTTTTAPAAVTTKPVTTTTKASDIKPATNLAGSYDAGTKSAKLTWTFTETKDIDGYKIYRSDTATGSYAELAKVAKDINSYEDKTIAVEKTYFYQIKAYKTTALSAASNTVELKASASTSSTTITTAKPTATTKAVQTQVKGSSVSNLLIYLVLAVLFIVGAGVFAYFKIFKKPSVKKPEIEKPENKDLG